VIRLSGRIVWQDGRVQEIVVTQREWTDWELWAIGRGLDPSPVGPTAMTMQRFLGYAYVQRAAGLARANWPPFEDWMADDVELEPGEDGAPVSAAANPTPVVRSAG
jgi:hypothetical protein